jgi:hypothetical protein
VIGVRETTLADGLGTSEGYYEEGREGRIIPYGTRSESGTLMGVGPGRCELLRTPLRRSSQNVSSMSFLNKGKKGKIRSYQTSVLL